MESYRPKYRRVFYITQLSASAIILLLLSTIFVDLLPQQAFAFVFGGIKNLSASAGFSSGHDMAESGTNVFVTWVLDGVIMLAYSSNSGQDFSTAVQISDPNHTSSSPKVAASGDNSYIVWQDPDVGAGDIFIRKATVDSEGALTLGSELNLSSSVDTSSFPQVSTSGSNVYVLWEEDFSGFTDILYAASPDSSTNFSSQGNLSNSDLITSLNARLVSSGDEVYITWIESDLASDVYFAKGDISSGTLVLDTSISLSQNFAASAAFFPASVSVSGTNVYVVWGDGGVGEIFYAASQDGGGTFDIPADESDNVLTSGGSSSNPAVLVSGDNVFITWYDSTFDDVFFVKGTVTGGILSFGTADNVSNDPDPSLNAKVAASGSDVYVVWDSSSEVFLSVSTSSGDGGSFSIPVNLSGNAGFSHDPLALTSSTNLYVTWLDDTEGTDDLFFKLVRDLPVSISISPVTDDTPRWGLDVVQASGLVTGDATDAIEVEWGDGSTDSATVTGNSWGPISHTYASTATGARTITARLLDASMVERASDTLDINVQKHATSLTIGSITSVVKGSDITAAGTLTDTDASVSVSGKSITFTGTGAVGLASTTTSSGAYSSTGGSPSTASPLLSVQAHFAGDDEYLAADSTSVYYDTVETGAATFVVPAGTPSGPITLTGFGASIQFDNVPSAGSIFVSTCSSPTSARYLLLDSDTCVQISPVVTMASGTAAHITVSFDGKTIPPGHTADEISIFHETSSGVVDITESRDVSAKTVTGKTTSFSRFIVGVALHDATAGAKSKQVFVGSNDISFDFTETRAISLPSYIRLGDAALITVTDSLANTNKDVKDTITATITSASDTTGITVTLTETGANTGKFFASFIVTQNTSDAPNAALHAAAGDSISASYEAPTAAPLRIVLSDVSEAGIIEAVPYDAPAFLDPVGDAFSLSFKDAELATGATITVTLSYANAQLLSGDDPANLRIFRTEGMSCKESLTGGAGHDPAQKTVTGTTTTLGEYTLGLNGPPAPGSCPAGPGGGGGGLPRPGSGLVLDAVAAITGASTGGDGSSSGGSSSAASVSGANSLQVSSGNDVSTTTNVGSETVKLDFESVQGAGSVSVTSMDVSQQAGLFSQVTNTNQGTGSVGGSQFSTAGTLFDVSTTASYSGPVQITIPYNESFVTDEQNVRFLHHSQDGWEDGTIAIDTEANTVTGQVTSLSPVVAGVIADGTFGDVYFVTNPTKKMAVMDSQVKALGGDLLVSGGQASLQATIKNLQRANQTYAFIVQVIDEKGFTQRINWQTGELGMGEGTVVSSNWTGESGTYKVRMFVWTGISAPAALSEVATRDVAVA